MRKLIVVKQLSLKYSDELAEILSTDKKLHKELSPNSKLTTINGLEYVQGCIKWETKKRGRCFAIVKNDRAVGSISFVHKDDEIAKKPKQILGKTRLNVLEQILKKKR